MKIGIIISRIGGIDGVSLETEKWIKVLKKLGHEIFILTGRFQRDILDKKHQTEKSELYFFSKENNWVQEKSFLNPTKTSKRVIKKIKISCENISNIIVDWIQKNNLNLIISENASALPYHFSLGIGISLAVKKTKINVIAHDHDFYWERGKKYTSPHKEINDMMEKSFPIRNGTNIKHVVINTAAKKYLKKKFNINATIIPNVLDFNIKLGNKTEYNKDLLKDLGLKKTDIPLFQITRIIKRKGIETAINLIKELNDPRVKLIMTGWNSDETYDKYYDQLKNKVHKLNLDDNVIFAIDKFNNYGSITGNINYLKIKSNEKKIYSISDAYAYAKACTYFSKYEGFGNGFLEAVLAKKPIFVNNYKPVFWQDIGSKGFKVVMIENNKLTKKAINDIKEIIYNSKLSNKIVNHNFKIGKKYFSFKILEKKLKKLIM